MQLLVLTPQLPYPPHQGTTIRNFNILKGLARHHEIDLLSFGGAPELSDSPLSEYCRRIETVPPPSRSPLQRAVETFTDHLPDMARRLYSPAMADAFSRMTGERAYDAIQIEGIEMASFWLSSVPVTAPRPFVLFDDHNAEYVLQRTAYETDRRRPRRWPAALYSFIQWHKLARFERDLCLRAGRVVAVSPHDAAALAALDRRIKPAVVPNGVDVAYYAPCQPVEEQGGSLVFTGKMDYRPNIDAALWFSQEVLPLVRREIPETHVSFVGQSPAPGVRLLSANPGVEVTGGVPDTRPFISRASVFVVPLRMGGGTRLKVLEAMAMGKAIVSTSLGATGIEYEPGRELLIADSAADFASAVIALLRNPARRRELGATGRQLAAEKYDWNRIVPLFEQVYADCGRQSFT